MFLGEVWSKRAVKVS